MSFPLNSDTLFLSFIINDLKKLSNNFQTILLVWIRSSVDQMLTKTYGAQQLLYFVFVLVNQDSRGPPRFCIPRENSSKKPIPERLH